MAADSLARAAAPRPLPAPTVAGTIALYLDAAGLTRSVHTQRTYDAGLCRFSEYLAQEGWPPATTPTTALPPTIVEGFAHALLRRYGAGHRTTVATYLAPVRGWVKLLARRGLLPPGTTREQFDRGLHEFLGRAGPYKKRRVDTGAMAALVQLADQRCAAMLAEPAAAAWFRQQQANSRALRQD